MHVIETRRLTVRRYLVVAIIALVSGAVSTTAVFYVLENRLTFATISIPPISLVTWLILVHFMDWRPSWRGIAFAVLIGALSPVVGCIVALTYAGAGFYMLFFAIHYYLLICPFGIATSIAIYFTLRRGMIEQRGFPVLPLKEQKNGPDKRTHSDG